jgi:hypothetical protein
VSCLSEAGAVSVNPVNPLRPYFLLSLVVGPVFFVRVGANAASAVLSGAVLSAFFAWRVTRGGRISRMLLIVGAWTGVIAAVIMLTVRFSWADIRGLAACGGTDRAAAQPGGIRAHPATGPDEGLGSEADLRRVDGGRAPSRCALVLPVEVGVRDHLLNVRGAVSGQVS